MKDKLNENESSIRDQKKQLRKQNESKDITISNSSLESSKIDFEELKNNIKIPCISYVQMT